MSLTDRFKASFVTGLVLLAPLIVTAFVLKLGSDWLFRFVDPLVAGIGLTRYTANDELVARVVAIVFVVLGIALLGYVTAWGIGRRLFLGFGRVLDVIPLVSTIYTNVRRVANALMDSDSRYERAVLVEYPRDGLFAYGLVTGESSVEVSGVTGEPTYNVYIPNSPNPTAGHLALVPEDRVHEIDMSVRRSIRTVVTTGIGEEDPLLAGNVDAFQGHGPEDD